MTIEEKAEEYVNSTYTHSKEAVKQAYIAGAKENGIVWHKVADGDLPKDNVRVLSEKGHLVVYKAITFNWFEFSPNADNIKLRKWEEPIAWCEIPTYTEE